MSEPAPTPTRQFSGPRPPRTEELNSRTLYRHKVSVAIGPVDWTPLSIDEVAQLFPQFEILEFLGRGGMGAVYKARQTSVDRLIAIKILPVEIAAEENFAERFSREAKTLARLCHSHIVGVYDFGTTPQGHSWFSMEYVDGAPLHSLIEARTLTPAQALQIMVDVCEGLCCAHEHGVIHRDVKPSNVLVDRHGRAKIADFGIARVETPDQPLHTTGTLFGTPSYMAPEQMDRKQVDHRADIFALGVMLYETLCHQVPRGNVDPPSRRMGADPRIDAIIAKAMQNDPTRRHQSTRELLVELRRVALLDDTVKLERKPASTPPGAAVAAATPGPTVTYARRRFLRRYGISIGVGAVVVLALGLAWHSRGKHLSASLPPIGAFDAPPDRAGTGHEKWQDLIAEEENAGQPPEGLYLTPKGYATRAPAGKPGVYLMTKQPMQNEALRVTYLPDVGGTDAGLQLILRSSLDFKDLYRVHAFPTEWQIVKRTRNGEIQTLTSIPKTEEMKRPGARTVEFRAEGDRLAFYFNGKFAGSAHDPTFAQGRARVHSGEGIVFQKVEYADLDK